MEFPNLRVIEKLHAEIDEAASRVAELERAREEERRSREEAASKVAELEQAHEEERRSREEALSMAELDRQRLRDTARNILKAGQPVEQVVQWTGLSVETVRALAAQLQ
ncbi:MAG: hypothetical protein LBB83_02685 [Treponema sp.]|nr:hypothetical protein [Treponema sp.]